MLAKRASDGSVSIHLVEMNPKAIPISESVVGTIPAVAIPRYYERDSFGNLVAIPDTEGNPNYAVGGSQSGISYSATNFKGNWYFTTGDDDIFRWDGTNFLPLRTLQPDPDLQNPIGAKIITSNDARLFMANCVDPESGERVPYRIAWSGTLEDNRWGGSEYRSGTSTFLDLAGENEPITALYTSSDFVVVFKPRTIYIGRFVGAPQYYSFRRLVRGPGCVSHQTLVEYRDGLLIWLGDDNVYIGYPGQNPKPLGNAIEDRIREVADLCRMDEARAEIDRDNHIYTLYVPLKDELNPHDDNEFVQNYKIFQCYIPTQAWFEGIVQGADVNVTSSIETRTNWWTTRQYVSSFDGQIYAKDFEYFRDKDAPFSCSYTTGMFNYERMTNAATQQADVQLLRVQATGGSVDLSLTVTNNLDREQTTTSKTQNSDGTGPLYVTMDKRRVAENFKITLSNEDASEFGKVAALSFSAIPEGDTMRYG